MRFSLIGPVYPYRGGITHFHSSMAQSLINSGHEIQVISFKRQYLNWLYPGKTDKDTSQKAVKIQALYTLDPIKPWTWFKAARQIKDFGPDQVIIQWWTTFWAIPYFFIARHLFKKNIPVIYTIHNVLPHEEKKIDRPLAKLNFKYANSFITLSDQETQRLRPLICSDKKIYTVDHPIYNNLENLRIPET